MTHRTVGDDAPARGDRRFDPMRRTPTRRRSTPMATAFPTRSITARWRSNADQRDHDVDGRGDVCDLCPHIPETTGLDDDDDGVGDACDPRPMTGGDTRALWVGFYDANDIANWPQNGTDVRGLERAPRRQAPTSGLDYTLLSDELPAAYIDDAGPTHGASRPRSAACARRDRLIRRRRPAPAYQCVLVVGTNGAGSAGLRDDAYPSRATRIRRRGPGHSRSAATSCFTTACRRQAICRAPQGAADVHGHPGREIHGGHVVLGTATRRSR